jgi:urease accessory protein
MNTSRSLPLIKLLQLVSPALPIGMYSYSQGMEKAVDDGWLPDETAVLEWLDGLLLRSLGRTDLPVLARLYAAWSAHDDDGVQRWSGLLRACRETDELRQEDLHVGQALARVLSGLGMSEAECWIRKPHASLATLFSLAGVRWSIDREDLMAGYAWGWLENQALCAIKLVPLGQSAGQRLLSELAARIPDTVSAALAVADEDIGGSSPSLGIVSSRHEVQYSRLFRS